MRGLATRTDLIFPRFDAEVVDHGGFILVRTPENPGFYWGNCLIFRDAPRLGDFSRWESIFLRELGDLRHRTMAWDVPNEAGEVSEFVAAGYTPLMSVVHATSQPPSAPRLLPGMEVRPLQTDAEWADAVELHAVCNDEGIEDAAYRAWAATQMVRHRRMQDAGRGAWFGGYLDGRLIVDMGLFHEGGIGRYQSVQTHPDFRRLGAAGTCVAAVGRVGLENFGLDRLVIIAREGSEAARLYQSVGFEPVETCHAVERRPA